MSGDGLLPIGRFSRVTGLSARALRNYDDVGLLVPTTVDPDTGYRLYGLEQIPRAQTIRQLRDLDVSLGAIAAILEADGVDLHKLLRAHQADVARDIAILQDRHRRLQRLIEGKERLMNGSDAAPATEEVHRRLAAELFNATWGWLEQTTRTAAEDDLLIHTAHASRYHWSQVGTTAHAARGEWLCARVYSVLGRGEPALWHARRCLALAAAGGEEFEDWDLASAYQGLAHALLTAGDAAEATVAAERCRAALQVIADPEDRALIESQLDELGLDA